jgi:hypothetical protein
MLNSKYLTSYDEIHNIDHPYFCKVQMCQKFPPPPLVQQPLVGQDLPIVEASQLIGLFWMSDQPTAENYT